MNRFARFGIAVLAAAALSMGAACSTLNGIAGGSSEPSVSPRDAVLAAADKIEPAVKEVTLLLAAGVISDNVADDIAEYGPTIQRIGAAYFDEARECLVSEGQLITDPTTGGDCAPSTLQSIYNAADAEITAWMIDASRAGDQQTAGYIAGARLIVSLVPKPVSGGPFPGYRAGPDVPLALFDARREALAASFEAMIEAARIRAGRAEALAS
jgi:hypothetical protein